MSMIYKVLESQIKKYGLTDEIAERIEVLYAGGRLTTEEYNKLKNYGNGE